MSEIVYSTYHYADGCFIRSERGERSTTLEAVGPRGRDRSVVVIVGAISAEQLRAEVARLAARRGFQTLQEPPKDEKTNEPD
jgi:hypothetical protein